MPVRLPLILCRVPKRRQRQCSVPRWSCFTYGAVTDEGAATLHDQPVRTYRRWKAGNIGRIGLDGRARLSNLMGIHGALRIDRIQWRSQGITAITARKLRLLAIPTSVSEQNSQCSPYRW